MDKRHVADRISSEVRTACDALQRIADYLPRLHEAGERGDYVDGQLGRAINALAIARILVLKHRTDAQAQQDMEALYEQIRE